jgi:hypothetical protein
MPTREEYTEMVMLSMVDHSNTDSFDGGYEEGGKVERERIAKLFDEAGWNVYAKLIRESL